MVCQRSIMKFDCTTIAVMSINGVLCVCECKWSLTILVTKNNSTLPLTEMICVVKINVLNLHSWSTRFCFF